MPSINWFLGKKQEDYDARTVQVESLIHWIICSAEQG